MSRTAPPPIAWSEEHQARTVALNVSARWVTIALELALGFVMLPFNIRHLGPSEYGLWMLCASIVAYLPLLDMGFGGALDRFVAHYRARRDVQSINELTSTLFSVFATIAATSLVVVALVAWQLDSLFNVPAEQARTGRIVLVLVGLQFAFSMPFSVFGSVVNGFQRLFLNASVAVTVAISVAVVNVTVLLAGGSLVQLVAATTVTRLFGMIVYRRNAYRVFPLLRVSPALFRRTRLRELTSFSVFMLVQQASNRLNYATDPMVIAAFLAVGPVAVWTVAQRLADMVLRLTNQLNDVLFPVVVDCDSAQRDDRLQELLVQGTRISLALVLPAAGTLALLAHQVVQGWTGPAFRQSGLLVQLMAFVVMIRVGTATAETVLRGGGRHRLLAFSNAVAAAVNVVLSIILVRTHGLPGVAIATLIPVGVRALLIVVPGGCRRAGIPVRHLARHAVWPALWPAALTLGGLALVRHQVPPSLLAAVTHGAVTGAIYLLLFVGVAIGGRDRERYVTKLRSIVGRPALGTA